jgi:hypothetical protein
MIDRYLQVYKDYFSGSLLLYVDVMIVFETESK